jgi:hypothetical protein
MSLKCEYRNQFYVNELADGDMEQTNRLKGRDVFVDEETCAFIHSVNSMSKKTPEEWEELGNLSALSWQEQITFIEITMMSTLY